MVGNTCFKQAAGRRTLARSQEQRFAAPALPGGGWSLQSVRHVDAEVTHAWSGPRSPPGCAEDPRRGVRMPTGQEGMAVAAED